MSSPNFITISIPTIQHRYLFYVVLSVLGLSIAEVILASKYENDDGCNNDKVLNPKTWMLIDGAISIGLIFTMICEAFGFFPPMEIPDEHGQIIAVTNRGRILIRLITIFLCIWVIVGAVILWRDNLTCEPQQFHDIFWAAIIIRLVYIVLGIVEDKNAPAMRVSHGESV